MALTQHKQELVKAIKAKQYIAAAAVLEKALAISPEDALLLEFQAAVQAKLRLDHDVSSSDSDDDDESECSQNDRDGAFGADEQEHEDDNESTDEESSCSTSSADDEGDSNCADPTSGTAAATTGAMLDGGSGQGHGGAQLQPSPQNLSQQACSLGAEVSSISLAASSSTLTWQHRLQLRQQLAASISQQKDELVQQQLLKNDLLLAAL